MNKRMKQLRRHNELFIWQGDSDQGGWDQFRGMMIVASSPEHAVHVLWKSMLHWDQPSIYTLTEEQILGHMDDANNNGLPVPKMWEHILTKVKPDWQEDFAKWTWEKVGKALPRDSAGVLMTDYHNG